VGELVKKEGTELLRRHLPHKRFRQENGRAEIPMQTGEPTLFPMRSLALVLTPADFFAASNNSESVESLTGEEERRSRIMHVAANKSLRRKIAHPAAHARLITPRHGNGEAVLAGFGHVSTAGPCAPATGCASPGWIVLPDFTRSRGGVSLAVSSAAARAISWLDRKTLVAGVSLASLPSDGAAGAASSGALWSRGSASGRLSAT